MNTIDLGGTKLRRIGLGTNRITDTAESREILRYAVERGINFIDTAHLYTGGTSERVIGETLAPFPPELVVASKCGYAGGSPDVLRRELEQSLVSLKADCITLYQLHRVNPKVDIEVSVGTLKEFQDEGKIKHIGLSEVTVDQIKRARQVAEIASVQNHYNLSERGSDDVVDYCAAEGIIFIPYFPLHGRGGKSSQEALTWLLERSPMMLPIPGTLSKAHLDENLEALDIDKTQA